jgi:hypothetical protein
MRVRIILRRRGGEVNDDVDGIRKGWLEVCRGMHKFVDSLD